MTEGPAVANAPAGSELRAEIAEVARGWIGTPYRHQSSARGVGADCLGLVRGVWRAVYGEEPESPPPYTPDWSEVSGEERLLDAASRHLLPWPIEEAGEGDLLIFKLRRDAPAKHLALLGWRAFCGETMIHAYSGRAVVENALTRPWRARIAAVYRFPVRS